MFEPDFTQLHKVLRRQAPERPVLFEYQLNDRLLTLLAGMPKPTEAHKYGAWKTRAYANAGYDYVTLDLAASADGQDMRIDEELYSAAAESLPKSMKIIPCTPCRLKSCQIKSATADYGQRLHDYFNSLLPREEVGAVLVTEDAAGMSLEQMRELIIPWHKRIVAAAHHYNKPAILHACHMPEEAVEDIISECGYDALYCLDDIMPVERAYEKLAGRVALLGGMDAGFMQCSTPREIERRCKALLALTKQKGGYALGTCSYNEVNMPDVNYLALLEAYTEMREACG